MNFSKFLLAAIFATFLFSCDTELSINSVNVDILNKDNEVSEGEKLRVEFKVRDSEGIDYVLIEIPVLNAESKIEDYSDKNKWEFEEHFLVENVDVTGEYEVFITVLDKSGNQYLETKEFTIK